jgi:hypothetical protein
MEKMDYLPEISGYIRFSQEMPDKKPNAQKRFHPRRFGPTDAIIPETGNLITPDHS